MGPFGRVKAQPLRVVGDDPEGIRIKWEPLRHHQNDR
jgi:hypothetical protein